MADLESYFPGLHGSNFEVTSPEDIRYNCIAWTVGDIGNWWWPDDDSQWPADCERAENLAAFVAVYTKLGFQTCDDPDREESCEKVAIYALKDGIPTHAAKQLENGLWSSKLTSRAR